MPGYARMAHVSKRVHIVVGRSRDCDLTLDDPTVSGRHARLAWDAGKIVVEDLGSANGTFVGDERIERTQIRPGDDLRFGRASLQWSDRRLRTFLRRGGSDTVQGLSIPGRRFICGACGTRGVMPSQFDGGVLRCGACGQRLIVAKVKRGWSRPLATVAAIALLAGGGYWVYSADAASPVREAAGRLLPDGSAGASSPQEVSIRIHTRDRVVGAIDTTNNKTRNEAVRIAADAEGPFSVEQVAQIWSEVRSRWRYVNDPRGAEYFAAASESIDNGYVGDCDDFAIVVVAMIGAIGGDARIVMMDGPQGGHAYAEVQVTGDPAEVRDRLANHYRTYRNERLGRQSVSTVHYRPGHDGSVWLNLDWNAGVPGGPYEQERWAVAIYADGRTETLAPFNHAGAEPNVAEPVRAASPPEE